jgi:hypothetical protein
MGMHKNNSAVLNHLYGLLIEMNFHRPAEDVFPDKKYQDDPFIMKHLQQIRLKTAQYKALMNRSRYAALLAEIKRLKEIGIEGIRKFINPQEALQLQPLFNKFEELSKEDEAAILEDAELLQLIAALKDKLDSKSDD